MSGADAVEQAARLAERTCSTFDDATFSIGENSLASMSASGWPPIRTIA